METNSAHQRNIPPPHLLQSRFPLFFLAHVCTDRHKRRKKGYINTQPTVETENRADRISQVNPTLEAHDRKTFQTTEYRPNCGRTPTRRVSSSNNLCNSRLASFTAISELPSIRRYLLRVCILDQAQNTAKERAWRQNIKPSRPDDI